MLFLTCWRCRLASRGGFLPTKDMTLAFYARSCCSKGSGRSSRIERMFNRIKQFRRVATRYDKTRKFFDGFLALVAAKIWLPYFVNRT